MSTFGQQRFFPPENPDVPLWRFMGFAKFVSMLEHEGLFFVRGNVLEDQFEGTYPRANAREQVPDELATEVNQWARQWHLVNCWHMNEQESAAMWKLYVPSSEGIAIRSTFRCLTRVLDEDTFVGTVAYLDYERQDLREADFFNSFLCKRKSFEHERELRAIRLEVPFRDGEPDLARSAMDTGTWVAVDLNTLIQAIHIAPAAQHWCVQLVEAVARRYGLTAPVVRSALDARPFT